MQTPTQQLHFDLFIQSADNAQYAHKVTHKFYIILRLLGCMVHWLKMTLFISQVLAKNEDCLELLYYSSKSKLCKEKDLMCVVQFCCQALE